jgi:hypothetical protein
MLSFLVAGEQVAMLRGVARPVRAEDPSHGEPNDIAPANGPFFM